MSSGHINNSKVPKNATGFDDSLSLSQVVAGKPICSEGLSANVRDGMRIINRGRRVDGPISLWSGTQG